jgi:glycerol uptake facilitator-like aquaporin
MFGQKRLAVLVAEFLGTAMLALAFYTIVARTSFPLFTGLAAAIAIGLAIMSVGGVSGAHINPAVTISMWTMRKIQTTTAVAYIAAQMLGGLAAWGLLTFLLDRSLTSMAPGNFDWRIFTAEAVGAGVFAFGAVAAVVNRLPAVQCAAVTGLSFALGILVASLASNAIINPAVAVGIQSWNWTYAVAPLVGAVVGANVYTFLFAEQTKTTVKKKK